MSKKSIVVPVLAVLLVMSALLNLYYIMPRKPLTDMTPGYYQTQIPGSLPLRFSITQDLAVVYFGGQNDVIWEGRLEYNENEDYYVIATADYNYQVVVQDDTVFMPVIEGDRVTSQLFKKLSDTPVFFGEEPRD